MGECQGKKMPESNPAADVLQVMELSLDAMRAVLPDETPLIFFSRLKSVAQVEQNSQAINPGWHQRHQTRTTTMASICQVWGVSVLFALVAVLPVIIFLLAPDLDGTASPAARAASEAINRQRWLSCSMPQVCLLYTSPSPRDS